MLIITSFTIEPVIAWIYRRDQARKLKRGEYKYLEWTSNGTLQLQRLAYQGIKSGKWSGYTDDIPMTETGALLGDLTQSYPEVPRDCEKGFGGTAGKTRNTAMVQAVTVASASGSSEAATGSSNERDAAPTLLPEAGESHLVSRAPSSLGGGDADEHGRDIHHQAARLGSVAGSVLPGSGTEPVSPVSPLPTRAPTPV